MAKVFRLIIRQAITCIPTWVFIRDHFRLRPDKVGLGFFEEDYRCFKKVAYQGLVKSE